MNSGVPQARESPLNDSLTVRRPSVLQIAGKRHRVLLGSLSTLIFASSAAGATGILSVGAATSFSAVLGSTVTDADSMTTFDNLGLRPGPSVLGAPYVLGQTHVHNAVAIPANNSPAIPYNSSCSKGDSSIAAGAPGQIALHADNNLGGVPGAIASPGCIRLATASVDWLAASEGPGAPKIHAL